MHFSHSPLQDVEYGLATTEREDDNSKRKGRNKWILWKRYSKGVYLLGILLCCCFLLYCLLVRLFSYSVFNKKSSSFVRHLSARLGGHGRRRGRRARAGQVHARGRLYQRQEHDYPRGRPHQELQRRGGRQHRAHAGDFRGSDREVRHRPSHRG